MNSNLTRNELSILLQLLDWNDNTVERIIGESELEGNDKELLEKEYKRILKRNDTIRTKLVHNHISSKEATNGK